MSLSLGLLLLIFPAAIFVAWGAARAALERNGADPLQVKERRVNLTVLSLMFSLVVLIAGAMPFYVAENAGPPGSGAAFVFLIWIGLGPLVSWLLIPSVYVFVTRLAFSLRCRRWCFPSVVTFLIVGFRLVAAGIDGKLPMTSASDLGFLTVFFATVFATWLFYVSALDKFGAPQA